VTFRKSWFMLKRLYFDIFSKPPEICASSEQILGYYYLKFEEGKLNKSIAGVDKDGIPVSRAYIDVEVDE